MDSFIEAAIKLSQGGPVIILVFIILALMYACKRLFEAYEAQSQKLIPAIEGTTLALETHTRTLQDMAVKSEVNAAAIRSVRDVLEAMNNRRR